MILAKKEYCDNPLTTSQIDKLGNALIMLCDNIKPLYKTKALKLLYLIEEISIRKYGAPFFGVDFQLWQLGPVQRDMYVELSEGPTMLKEFIRIDTVDKRTIVIPINTFSDDEFSDNDIDVLELVIKSMKNKTDQELISITHKENSPWYITAKVNGYLEPFEKNTCNSTNIVLDLSILLEDMPQQKEFYISTLDFQKQSNHLKRTV